MAQRTACLTLRHWAPLDRTQIAQDNILLNNVVPCLVSGGRWFSNSPNAFVAPARADAPAGWKYTGSKKQNAADYNKKMSEYRKQLAVLRNAWRPLVEEHNKKLVEIKAERDRVRLAAQEKDLQRQFDRWKVPSTMKTSQEIRSNPLERNYAYARHALHSSIAQVSRAAQAEVLLRESANWISPEEVDDAIHIALNNPQNLFSEAQPWSGSLAGIPEYVEGFEGPAVDSKLPAHVLRKRRKVR